MDDRNLADGDVKLVHYVITSIERDNERILADGEGHLIVTDDMSGEGFVSWTIARYFQQPRHEDLPESEKKYLRVCYRVLCRWPRQSLRFEQRQLDRLSGIETAIREKNGGGGGGRGGGGATTPQEQEVLRAVAGLGGSATIGQLLSKVGGSREEVQAALDRLVATGRLSVAGRGVTARYRLSETG